MVEHLQGALVMLLTARVPCPDGEEVLTAAAGVSRATGTPGQVPADQESRGSTRTQVGITNKEVWQPKMFSSWEWRIRNSLSAFMEKIFCSKKRSVDEKALRSPSLSHYGLSHYSLETAASRQPLMMLMRDLVLCFSFMRIRREDHPDGHGVLGSVRIGHRQMLTCT